MTMKGYAMDSDQIFTLVGSIGYVQNDDGGMVLSGDIDGEWGAGVAGTVFLGVRSVDDTDQHTFFHSLQGHQLRVTIEVIDQRAIMLQRKEPEP